jgi:proteasome lid subunit RPN8/RPN11
MDAFFSLPHGGAEIGGVLFGTRVPGGVRILACCALECEYAFGPSFTLSERDRQRLERLLASEDLRAEGWAPVGWYHSHTRSGIGLSARDLEIHERYFPDACDIALVVRPHALNPVRAGFFFREPDGTFHSDASYQEFRLLPAPSLPPRRAVTRIPKAVARPAPVALPSPSWIGFAACALLMLALGLWLLMHRPEAAGPPPAVSLMAYDFDGQLQIRWDGAARRVRNAASGALEITDGGAKTLISLDPPHLRSGSVSYARQSARVDVRLLLTQPDAKAFEELTTFLGSAPPAEDPPAGSATLRRQLQRQAARTRQLQRAIDQMQTEIRTRRPSGQRAAP